MIISTTPVRISFFGGGTDYPEHFQKNGGATMGTSIDKYTYITVNPLTEFFDYRIRVSYSKTELCRTVDEIQHPAVRECLRFLGIEHGIEISVVSDLPARSGLGSSSSFTVGLLHALHAFKGELVGHEQLAQEAVLVERERIRERVGLQDQYLCALGGLLHLQFQGSNQVTVAPVPVSARRLRMMGERLMLFYTGLQRYAHDILEKQLERIKGGGATSDLATLHAMVQQGMDVLVQDANLDQFGDLLHQGWKIKRSLSDTVSNATIDEAYEKARTAGAVGGKLLGAGGGGFLLLYVPLDKQADVRRTLSNFREVRFQFENQGSHLIFYRPQ